MAFEVRRRIKGVEITHRDNGGIEKQQGDNDGREQLNRVAMPFQTGKQSPSKYRMARWGLFEQTGEGEGQSVCSSRKFRRVFHLKAGYPSTLLENGCFAQATNHSQSRLGRSLLTAPRSRVGSWRVPGFE